MSAAYTDLHCHIIPGIDNGPSTLEKALLLARSLVNHGITQVVATPHYVEDYSQKYRRSVVGHFIRLSLSLKEMNIPLTVYLGGELLLTPALPKLAAEHALPTINGSSYLLIELPLFQPIAPYARDVLFKLQAYGYKPILAHPERVEALWDNISFIYELVKRGNYVQINLGSLGGLYGQATAKLARELLKYNLVQFIGSDSHDSTVLTMMQGELAAPKFLPALLKDNPEKVLLDEDVVSKPFKPRLSLGARIQQRFKR